jgi:hypothetical protein
MSFPAGVDLICPVLGKDDFLPGEIKVFEI